MATLPSFDGQTGTGLGNAKPQWVSKVATKSKNAKSNQKIKDTSGKAKNSGETGARGDEAEATKPRLSPEAVAQIEAMRTRLHETLGKVCLALSAMPRYRHMPLGDLQPMILEPLMRDRLVIASTRPTEGETALESMSGIAIWASVSPEVDDKIQEQVRAGVFPVRLQPTDWVSGDINWLFDIIAPNKKLTTAVISNFRQIAKQGDLRMHPLVARLVDPETLKKMGARPISARQDSKSDPNDIAEA